jgi:hypothetical protein
VGTRFQSLTELASLQGADSSDIDPVNVQRNTCRSRDLTWSLLGVNEKDKFIALSFLESLSAFCFLTDLRFLTPHGSDMFHPIAVLFCFFFFLYIYNSRRQNNIVLLEEILFFVFCFFFLPIISFRIICVVTSIISESFLDIYLRM